ncbi:MAG: hypothetical protein H6718_21695 [Polyangiaceae bacterium]|nr:hypothetical protein [Polyangiaceae bacterium]
MQGYPGGGYAPPGHGQGFVPPQGGGGVGRLQLYTSFFPLMWFLFFAKPTITIDGQPQQRPWGTTYFDLPEGVHYVQVHFANLFGPGGKAERQFQIWAGHTTKLSYSAPFLFAALAGTLTEGGTEAMHQLPPGPGHY